MDMVGVNVIILICCIVGLLYSFLCAKMLNGVKIVSRAEDSDTYGHLHEEEEQEKVSLILEIGTYIENGANAFLFAEYQYIAVFVVLMAVVLFCTVEQQWGHLWSTFAFICGAFTSLASGYIGMRVATFSNYRCAYEA